MFEKGGLMKQALNRLRFGVVLCAAIAGHSSTQATPADGAGRPADTQAFNHHVAYLEAINAKYDEVQGAIATSAGDAAVLGRWQEVLWTHVSHLLGLVKEAVEFEQTNVWVWTDDYKFGLIKYIGPLPQEANRTFAQEDSLQGRYDATTRRVTLSCGSGLESSLEMPALGQTRSLVSTSMRYTRLVTYLTEEVERLLACERACAQAMQKPTAKPKVKQKPKPKPKPEPVLKPKPVPTPKPVPVVKPLPVEPELPAFEDDEDDEGLFAFLAFPEFDFGGTIDPELGKKILLTTGAVAGSLSVLHFTDQYYLHGALGNKVRTTLAATHAQLGRALNLGLFKRALGTLSRSTRSVLAATGAYIVGSRVARGLRAVDTRARAFARRMADGTSTRLSRFGSLLVPTSFDVDF